MAYPQPGFNISTAPPSYPGYPSQPQQPYNNNQPFPAPIQQQPVQQMAPIWYNHHFQNYLQNANAFRVKQKVEMLEALVGWETGNKYSVSDHGGNKIFYVGEESDACGRQLCNAKRAFNLTVKDVTGHTVLYMERGLNCSCCCGLLCPDSLRISTAAGQPLGSVVETFDLLHPTFNIKDAAGNTVLRIRGPLCPMSIGKCSGNAVFRVLNMADVPVGVISKEWGGVVRELFTDADQFSITFPYDSDPAIKAVLLGALFLIDYEYFESGTLNKNQGGRRLFG